MKSFIIKYATAFSVMLFMFAACKKERYVLEYKLDKGNVYKHLITTDITTNQNAGGQEVTVKSSSQVAVSNEVIDIKDSMYIIKSWYDKAAMGFDAGAVKLNFSSDDTLAMATLTNIGPLLRAVTAKPFEINFSRKGNIEGINGFDVIEHSIVNVIDADSATKEQLKNSILKSFGHSTFKSIVERFSAIYPNHPVAVGESWDIAQITTDNLALHVNSKLILKEIKDNIAIIGCQSTISSSANENEQEMNKVKTQTKVDGTQSGVIKVDLKTGWVTEGEMTQDLKGTIKISQSDTDGLMEIPVNMKVNIKQTLIQ